MLLHLQLTSKPSRIANVNFAQGRSIIHNIPQQRLLRAQRLLPLHVPQQLQHTLMPRLLDLALVLVRVALQEGQLVELGVFEHCQGAGGADAGVRGHRPHLQQRFIVSIVRQVADGKGLEPFLLLVLWTCLTWCNLRA